MQLTGAQILVHSLKSRKRGIRFWLSWWCGVGNLRCHLPIHKFEHILTRHEQAAVHAADAYARTSGKVGVALVTSGPGATNAITGIATAYTDSIPIVVISGQVASPAIGSDAFQEIDMIGISRPCVKHNFLVTHIDDLVPTIKKAFQIAKTGRPGPVVVDIAKRCNPTSAKFSYPQEEYFYFARYSTRCKWTRWSNQKSLANVGGGKASIDLFWWRRGVGQRASSFDRFLFALWVFRVPAP